MTSALHEQSIDTSSDEEIVDYSNSEDSDENVDESESDNKEVAHNPESEENCSASTYQKSTTSKVKCTVANTAQTETNKQITEKKDPFHNPILTWKEKLYEKHKKLKGKILYIRFPYALPTGFETLEKNVKALCNRIMSVNRPRQKSTRFCSVSFEREEDRSKAIEELSNVEINGKKLVLKIPNTESDNFIQKIIEKKLKKKAVKAEKRKLKSAANKKNKKKVLTSTLVLQNIPKGSTASNLKLLFPNAIEIQIKELKGNMGSIIATVEFLNSRDATRAGRKEYVMDGNKLIVTFFKNKKENTAKKHIEQKNMPQKRKIDENISGESLSSIKKICKESVSEKSFMNEQKEKNKIKMPIKNEDEIEKLRQTKNKPLKDIKVENDKTILKKKPDTNIASKNIKQPILAVSIGKKRPFQANAGSAIPRQNFKKQMPFKNLKAKV